MKKNINWVIIEPWKIYAKYTHIFNNITNYSSLGLRYKILNMFKKKYKFIDYKDQLDYSVLSILFYNVSLSKEKLN